MRSSFRMFGLLVCFVLLSAEHTAALFFGALGGGGGGGCCCCMPMSPCCGLGGLAAPQTGGGCAGGATGGGGMFGLLGGGGGCSGGVGHAPPAPNYALPTLPTAPFPSFPPPALPQPLPLGTAPAPAAYVVPPTENSSGGSPSYAPFSLSSGPSAPPPPPPIPTAGSYADLRPVDTVDEKKIGNEITGIDSPADKVVKPPPPSSGGNDFYEEKVPDLEDYGDVTSNRSGKEGKKSDLLTADYSEQSFAKTKGTDLMNAASEQDTTGDPKCSSETLRTIMQENIVSSPTISKQLIFSAGRLSFGQTIDVICSRSKFSYTVVSSKIFCEQSRGRITCFAFLQP